MSGQQGRPWCATCAWFRPVALAGNAALAGLGQVARGMCGLRLRGRYPVAQRGEKVTVADAKHEVCGGWEPRGGGPAAA